MSDVSRGDGWWRAADGLWYPPYMRSGDPRLQAPRPAAVAPTAVAPTAGLAAASPRPTSPWRSREAPFAFAVAALAAVALLVGAAGWSSGTPSPSSGHVGQVVYDGGMVFKVAGITCGVTHVGSRYFGTTAPAGSQWCIAAVGVANTTATPQGFAAWNQYAVDTSGRSLPADMSAMPYLSSDGDALYAALEPGAVIEFRIPFRLSRSGRIDAVELHASATSAAVTVENRR